MYVHCQKGLWYIYILVLKKVLRPLQHCIAVLNYLVERGGEEEKLCLESRCSQESRVFHGSLKEESVALLWQGGVSRCENSLPCLCRFIGYRAQVFIDFFL